jgi:hypothetical protein
MKLTVSNQERLKLMRTLRWVLTATMMDVHEASMLEDIVRRLASLEKPPIPPKINT